MNYDKPITLVACEIFADELQVVLKEVDSDFEILWLEAALHTDVAQLKLKIESALSLVISKQKRPCVLYGNSCLPDANDVFLRHNVQGFSACNCIEAFLGKEERQRYEAEGCFILTPGWIRAWPAITASLGWDAVDVRANLGRYTKILVFDSGVNPLTDEEVIQFFDLTGLFVELKHLDLKHFELLVKEVLLKKYAGYT